MEKNNFCIVACWQPQYNVTFIAVEAGRGGGKVFLVQNSCDIDLCALLVILREQGMFRLQRWLGNEILTLWKSLIFRTCSPS